MALSDLKPKKPYLIRAYYHWLCDSHLTPYCLVDTQYPNVIVPQKYVQHNQIILNLHPAVCGLLEMTGTIIKCNLRFEKVPYSLQIPMQAIKAIYAKENGWGVGFSEQHEPFELGEPSGWNKLQADKNSSHTLQHSEETAKEAKRRGITLLK